MNFLRVLISVRALGIRKTDKNFDGKLDEKEFTGLMHARERRRKMI